MKEEPQKQHLSPASTSAALKESLRQELIQCIRDHAYCFGDGDKMDRKIAHIQQVTSLWKLKKEQIFLNKRLAHTDLEKAKEIDALRDALFQFIHENNLNVWKAFLKEIAQANSKRQCKYLLYQLKELYKLNLHDLENTHSSLFALLVPMGGKVKE